MYPFRRIFNRIGELRSVHLPLPTAYLHGSWGKSAITALSVLPPICLFLQLALLVYGMELPLSPVLLSAGATFLLAGVRFYRCLAEGFDFYDTVAVLFMGLALLVAVRDFAVTSEKLILFLMLPALIWVMRGIPHPRIYRGVVIGGGALLAGFYLLVAHTGIATARGIAIANPTISALTLGYGNPNETGIYLLLVIFLNLYGAALLRRLPVLSIPLILLSVSEMRLLIRTDSRTCILIAALLYAVFLVTLVPSLRALMTSKGVLLCALSFPLLFFLAVYFNLFGVLHVSILDEPAESGRHLLYRSVIAALSPLDFLIGNHAANAGVNQHNAYLALLAAYGLAVTVAFVAFVYFFIRRLSPAHRSHPASLAYGFILCLIVHNSAEASVFTSGGVYAILTSLPFALACTHLTAPFPKKTNRPRLVLINTVYRRGSTGMIVEKLRQSAEDAGYEVLAVHRYGSGEGDSGVISASSWLDCHVHNRLARITGLGGFFSRMETYRLLREIKEYGPDLVHLNNLHGSYLHLPSLFRYLKKSGVKTVWTLHDCWALTGLCPHFAMLGCDRWKTGCGNCPYARQSAEMRLDLSRFVHRQKKKWLTGLPSLALVAPSLWLAELTRDSQYLSKYPVRVIYNGIDLNTFRPTESDFRERFGLEGKTVLLGVAFGWGKRKGLDVFAWLAERLDERFRIVLVGVDEKTGEALPDSILKIPRTGSPRELAAIYTAADLFVNPTREEVLGLVNVEALACGTPGVTFAAGGSPECYDAASGSVVRTDDHEALLAEIVRITEERPYTAEACVKRAAAFAAEERYAEYLKLYGELLWS